MQINVPKVPHANRSDRCVKKGYFKITLKIELHQCSAPSSAVVVDDKLSTLDGRKGGVNGRELSKTIGVIEQAVQLLAMKFFALHVNNLRVSMGEMRLADYRSCMKKRCLAIVDNDVSYLFS